jgi:hypothetical protein
MNTTKTIIKYINLGVLIIFMALIIMAPLAGLMFAMFLGGLQVLSSIVLALVLKNKNQRIGHAIHAVLSIILVTNQWVIKNWDFLLAGSIILGIYFLALIIAPEKYVSKASKLY